MQKKFKTNLNDQIMDEDILKIFDSINPSKLLFISPNKNIDYFRKNYTTYLVFNAKQISQYK